MVDHAPPPGTVVTVVVVNPFVFVDCMMLALSVVVLVEVCTPLLLSVLLVVLPELVLDPGSADGVLVERMSMPGSNTPSLLVSVVFTPLNKQARRSFKSCGRKRSASRLEYRYHIFGTEYYFQLIFQSHDAGLGDCRGSWRHDCPDLVRRRRYNGNGPSSPASSRCAANIVVPAVWSRQ